MVVVQFYPTHYYYDRLTQSELPPFADRGALIRLARVYLRVPDGYPHLVRCNDFQKCQ